MAEVLSASTVMQLQNSAIDSGANFLIGAATSPFDPNFDENKAGLMSVVGGAMGAASGAANIAGSAINTAALSANIVAEGIAYLSQNLTEYVAQATVKLMTIPMDKVTAASAKCIQESTFKPKDIIDKLTKGAEEFSKGVQEEMEKQQQLEIKNGATSKIKKVSKTVTDALTKAQKEMNAIASYVQKGPEWMDSQVQKYSYLVMTQVSGNVDKVVEDFDTIKNEWAESAGQAIAAKVVQPINAKLVDAQKKILEKIESAKQKAMITAKAAVAQAMMKIKGLLGG